MARETSKHLKAFEAWYAAGRSFRTVSDKFGLKRSTFYGWADQFNWHERADARDVEAKRLADEEAIQQRAERAKRRRRAAELLTARGTEFLTQNKFESGADAIRAIKYGTEVERKEDGIPDWVMMILNADTDSLEAMAKFFGNPDAAGEETGEGDDFLSSESDAEEE